MKRHVIIHGHFYQPPRKNPWSGILARQKSASPADNWNERILNECYMPNTRARWGDEKVNNYGLISHNIGPTLSGWMAENYIDIYRKIVSAGTDSGSAMALPYNHTILPLDNEFIRNLQVQWGIRHFELNYKRKPEGMWLPECAIDYKTADELVKAGIKFIYLTPGQAEAVKRIKGYQWYDVPEGSIDIRRPYRLFTESGYLDVFFSIQELAVDMSFRKILNNPQAAAEKIEKAFGHKHTEELVLTIVTDGETFGHHHKGAEMGLAKLLKYELPARGIESTTPGAYLKDRNPEWEVRIKDNSSWSCPHGLHRWMDDCGCGAEKDSNLKWRKPLRNALSWLGERIVDAFKKEAVRYFKVPPREAAINFAGIMSAPSMLEGFHLDFVKDEFKNTIEVNKIIELMHFTCYMFTSCGWFFGSLRRLEPVQNLSVALRALELLKELWSIDLEAEFYERLNHHEDVEDVWNNIVKARKKEPGEIAKDFMDVYSFTGIKRSRRGYWYMEIIKEESGPRVRMENMRTGEVLDIGVA